MAASKDGAQRSIQAVLCDVGSLHGLCGDLREGLLVAVNCQNCFYPTLYLYDIFT